MQAQIVIIDCGGQYAHLIARRVRECGVYAEIVPSNIDAKTLFCKGVIISGGPQSVYDEDSPKVDPAIFELDIPVLGICYGMQLMAHMLGGIVRKGDVGEYGPAEVTCMPYFGPIFTGTPSNQRVWMSHRDQVVEVPDGFTGFATTANCPIAGMQTNWEWEFAPMYGLQFHPEVVHTTNGHRMIRNFVESCECNIDWNNEKRREVLETNIRETVGDRNVLFFVSGGVDSAVAYTLTKRVLGAGRVAGYYIDTGLMREGDNALVAEVDPDIITIDANKMFLDSLDGVVDPEAKRHIIGENFVALQQDIIGMLDFERILGQGTIYPDTIESGGTKHADIIKTHHNRVNGIQKLIKEGKIVEPISMLYKDEVREVGRELGLPEDLISRHPFPGPGLAIRCLCSSEFRTLTKTEDGYIIPIKSVGVQGDSRTYRNVMAVSGRNPADMARFASDCIAKSDSINRVVRLEMSQLPMASMNVYPATITRQRIEILRAADVVVRKYCRKWNIDEQVWQFPVVLIPVGCSGAPNSVVLRPIHSVDGMTADPVVLTPDQRFDIAYELLWVTGISAVFYDFTPKPPGTIEWE